MRFGWLTLSLSSSPREDKQNIDNVLIQAQEAEKLGFEDFSNVKKSSLFLQAPSWALSIFVLTENEGALGPETRFPQTRLNCKGLSASGVHPQV